MTKSKKVLEFYEKQRILLSDLAIKGSKIKNCGKMCSSCAFKKDSPANLEPHNVSSAMDALLHGQFNCHIETGIDLGKPCKGFMNALQIIEPERKLREYTPKNVFECPNCKKVHADKNDKLWNRSMKNKSGFTYKVCDCSKKLLIMIDYTGKFEVFIK